MAHTVLVKVSITVINTMTKSNLGRIGLLQFTIPHPSPSLKGARIDT